MLVERIMNRPVVTCRPESTAWTVAGLMWDHDCGVIPVVDSTDRIVGVVTDRDLCMAAMIRGQTLGEIPVSEVMSRQVATCRPENTLDFAEKLMCERQVHRIPVVDEDGHPVGMASLSDIARESQQATSAKQRAAVTRTLANVCRPRGALTKPKKPRTSATR